MRTRFWPRILAPLTALALSGCGLLDGPAVVNIGGPDIPRDILTQVARQNVLVQFRKQINTTDSTPLSPLEISRLTFDRLFERAAADYNNQVGVQETLPFIEPGEHLIELQLPNLPEALQIPVIVPKDAPSPLHILVVLAFSSDTNTLQDIQVGYDYDRDGRIDRNQPQYQSSNGRSYILYLPDGSVQEWRSRLTGDDTQGTVAPEGEAPIPPGAQTLNPTVSDDRNPTAPQDRGSQTPPAPVPQIPIPRPDPLPLPVPAPR
jgi:hypothetical protein